MYNDIRHILGAAPRYSAGTTNRGGRRNITRIPRK